MAPASVNIRMSTSLARRATPADENGRPTGIDTLLMRRVGTGCEPVIRIVKEPWRLSPVAFRCLSTASVLHLEEHFRGKDLAAGALCWDDLIKVEHACRELETQVTDYAGEDRCD